jgi:glyoxylase-like metal-dependent hydrolase (beta-lactamase superfamily II)
VVLDPIDLRHLGNERVIGVYLVETPEGLALHDCGPRTCVDALERGLRERGVALTDVEHLLLSHIHLDHAGAAGTLVRRHPRLRVHVSEVGAPHVVDPSRLLSSARRLYGNDLERLWGEPEPAPRENVEVAGAEAAGLECFPTPGHAWHHVCFTTEDGTVLAGDATGVRIVPGRSILPAAPPPEIDLEAWARTLDEIERRRPRALALTHYGVVTDVGEHLERMRATLGGWAGRVRDGLAFEEWADAARADLAAGGDREGAARAELAAPLDQSYAGLARYWRKRSETAGASAQ